MILAFAPYLPSSMRQICIDRQKKWRTGLATSVPLFKKKNSFPETPKHICLTGQNYLFQKPLAPREAGRGSSYSFYSGGSKTRTREPVKYQRTSLPPSELTQPIHPPKISCNVMCLVWTLPWIAQAEVFPVLLVLQLSSAQQSMLPEQGPHDHSQCPVRPAGRMNEPVGIWLPWTLPEASCWR